VVEYSIVTTANQQSNKVQFAQEFKGLYPFLMASFVGLLLIQM